MICLLWLNFIIIILFFWGGGRFIIKFVEVGEEVERGGAKTIDFFFGLFVYLFNLALILSILID